MQTDFRRIVALLSSLALVVVGCSRYVEVPSTDYESIGPKDAKVHVVRTHDGQTIRVYDFEVTENAFVITAVSEENERVEIEPMTINFDDVESVERLGVNETTTTVVFILVGVAVAFVVFVIPWVDSWHPTD